MAWNHKSRVVAMAIAIQSVAGTITQPNMTTDIAAVAPPQNAEEIISAEDPTATGTIWQAPRIMLGKTATMTAMLPLRGPGGSAPPALGEWVPGRLLAAAGFAELRVATDLTATPGAGGTTTALDLTAVSGVSATDDFYIGYPVRHTSIGSGIKANTAIVDYNGTSKVATIGETLGSAITTGTLTIPASLVYQLGTLSSSVPLLSVSIWRDQKRYDFRDVRISQITIDMPVANESSQSFPSLEFQMKGIPVTEADEASPVVPASLLTALPPYRNGKFTLDKVNLGHQSTRFTATYEVAGPSNAAAAEGQDAYEIMGGTRTVEFDLNQMAVTDFNLGTRVDNQTVVPTMSLWGTTAGNRFAFTAPELYLDPFNNPGDRNGFVNLTGNAVPSGVNKSATLAVFW